MSDDARDEAAVGEVKVSADGTDWRDISSTVKSIDVEDHEHLTDKATIILDDPTGVLAHASFEGLEARVTLGWNTEKTTLFEGEIASARSVSQGQGAQVELTALDFTYRMSRHTPDPPMTWNGGQKLSEVITEIVSRPAYDILPFQVEPPVDHVFSSPNLLRQANVSDWEFIQQLAGRNNCRAFIEFDGSDRSKFYFVPIQRLGTAAPIGILRCCHGLGELISFEYERASSGTLTQTTVSATDAATGETVTHAPAPAAEPAPVPAAAPERDPDMSASRAGALQALTELAAAARRPAPTTVRQPGDAAHPGVAEARIVADPTRALGLRGTGVSTGTVKLRAKSRVVISGISPWAEGEWYVTKVNHVYTRQRVGQRRPTSYVSNFRATR